VAFAALAAVTFAAGAAFSERRVLAELLALGVNPEARFAVPLVPDHVAVLVAPHEGLPRVVAERDELQALGLTVADGRDARRLVATRNGEQTRTKEQRQSNHRPTHGRSLAADPPLSNCSGTAVPARQEPGRQSHFSK
jgi:hypothetical protein